MKLYDKNRLITTYSQTKENNLLYLRGRYFKSNLYQLTQVIIWCVLISYLYMSLCVISNLGSLHDYFYGFLLMCKYKDVMPLFGQYSFVRLDKGSTGCFRRIRLLDCIWCDTTAASSPWIVPDYVLKNMKIIFILWVCLWWTMFWYTLRQDLHMVSRWGISEKKAVAVITVLIV